MAKSRSRRSRKTRRGGAWYNPLTWFGQKTEEVDAPTGTPVSDIPDGVTVPKSSSSTTVPVTQGGRHRGRRHRTRRSKSRRSH